MQQSQGNVKMPSRPNMPKRPPIQNRPPSGTTKPRPPSGRNNGIKQSNSTMQRKPSGFGREANYRKVFKPDFNTPSN